MTPGRILITCLPSLPRTRISRPTSDQVRPELDRCQRQTVVFRHRFYTEQSHGSDRCSRVWEHGESDSSVEEVLRAIEGVQSVEHHQPLIIALATQADEPARTFSLLPWAHITADSPGHGMIRHAYQFCGKCRKQNRLTKTTAGLAESQIRRGLDMCWRSVYASMTTLRYTSLLHGLQCWL